MGDRNTEIGLWRPGRSRDNHAENHAEL